MTIEIKDQHLAIIYKPLPELVKYAKNARTHSDEQVSQIADSITEFGWTNPILIDDNGMIIAGHGRVLAGELLEYNEAPCIVLSGLTEIQKKAYVLADNKLSLNAGWDEELLELSLSELRDSGYNAALTGFSDSEIDALLKEANDSMSEDGLNELKLAQSIILEIEVETELEQEQLYKEFSERGYKCRLLTL